MKSESVGLPFEAPFLLFLFLFFFVINSTQLGLESIGHYRSHLQLLIVPLLLLCYKCNIIRTGKYRSLQESSPAVVF